jgi:hypothetical protein
MDLNKERSSAPQVSSFFIAQQLGQVGACPASAAKGRKGTSVFKLIFFTIRYSRLEFNYSRKKWVN